MRVTAVELRDFRNYERAKLALDERLTVVVGPNGAGKTNLLEALYLGATARSPRTSTERELVRRGSDVMRIVLSFTDHDGDHSLEVGIELGQGRRLKLDGAVLDGISDAVARPLMAVFLPDRLELVKGSPGRRRAHLDQVVAALWPSRASTRLAYARALAQRNALLAELRASTSALRSLDSWDTELARHGATLMSDRQAALDLLAQPLAVRAEALGLPAPLAAIYRPRCATSDADALASELFARRSVDLERGFTVHGPHRDDVRLELGGVALRTYGSQGQQRVGLLSLLLAERDVLLAERGRAPLMLLDDVMSELDAERRVALAEVLYSDGQALITATEPEHVPGATDGRATIIAVDEGRLTTPSSAHVVLG